MEHPRNMNLTSPHGLVLMVSKQEKPHPPNAFPILEVWNLYKFQINRREQWHHFSVCKSVSCNKNLTLSSTFTYIYLLKKAISIHIISARTTDLWCIRFFAECFWCLCNPRPTDRSKPWLVEASPSPKVPKHPSPVIPISQRDQYLKSEKSEGEVCLLDVDGCFFVECLLMLNLWT